MAAEPQFKTFLVEYPFEGETWMLEIKAKDSAEAEARCRALPWAKVKGESVVKISVPGGSWLSGMVGRKP